MCAEGCYLAAYYSDSERIANAPLYQFISYHLSCMDGLSLLIDPNHIPSLWKEISDLKASWQPSLS